MLSTTLSILLVAYLPGSLLFRAPIAQPKTRSALPAEERAFWYIALSVAISSIVGMGLAAIGWYQFERLLWVNGVLSVLLAALSRGRLRLPPSAPRAGPTALIPAALALVALACFAYVPPAEYVIGGRDPGAYLNEGVQIAQRGSLTINDSLVATVPHEFRDLFFPTRPRRSYYGMRFMAFFVVDPDQGRVVGQFAHLYPVWVAIGYGVNGLSGARQVVVLLAVLGVLAVYFCGVWLLGRTAAVVGTLLLTINVAQVWYSRYPNAEILLQFLTFASILAYSRSSVEDNRFFAPVAAVLLSLSVLAHLSGVLLVGSVGVAMLIGLVDERRLSSGFLVPLTMGLVLVAWYYTTTLTEYLRDPMRILLRGGAFSAGGMVASILIPVVIFWATRYPRARSLLRVWIPWCALAAIACVGIYAYFFRVPVGRLPPHDAYALREFAKAYVTPPGLAIAVLGLIIVSRRSFWHGVTFLVATLVFAGFVFYKIRIIPEHFWLARRFIPVILPATCLLMGAAIALPISTRWWQARTGLRRTAMMVPSVAVLVFLATQFFSATRPILGYVEYAGVIPQLEALQAEIADDDLVIVEARAASDLHTLALPLAYVYARQVLLLTGRDPDPQVFAQFLGWAREHHARVLFVGGGGNRILSRSTAAVPITTDQFSVPEYDRTYPKVPQEVRLKQFDYGLYELIPRVSSAEVVDLDIGNTDDLYVSDFYAKEGLREDEVSFRWSRGSSFVLIPRIQRDIRTMTVWMSAGGRPATLPPPTVDVYLTGRHLGTAIVTGDFQPYEFAITPAHADEIRATVEALQITISSDTWNPRDDLGRADPRDLGVMVDRLRIE